MYSITVTAMLNQDRHLELDLPAEIPAGPVEVTVRPIDALPTDVPAMSRDAARQRLQAAGILSTARYAPSNGVP